MVSLDLDVTSMTVPTTSSNMVGESPLPLPIGPLIVRLAPSTEKPRFGGSAPGVIRSQNVENSRWRPYLVPKLGRTPSKSMLHTQKFKKFKKFQGQKKPPKKPPAQRELLCQVPTIPSIKNRHLRLHCLHPPSFSPFDFLVVLLQYLLSYCVCLDILVEILNWPTVSEKWYTGQSCQNSTEMRLELYVRIICMFVSMLEKG